ncbi:MAG: cellulase family glycosylhydrolase [Oscillospiraceae bacterium]|nr:cellulase family glycosylhydrolase [Oscillospiraceae bacterium]
MNNFKKSLSVITAGILTAVLFTGCSEDDSKNSSSSSVAPTTSAQTSAPATSEINPDNFKFATEAPAETSAPQTTTTPAHVSPTEIISRSMANEKGQINKILNYDSNKTYKEKLSELADEDDRIESFTFVIYAEDGVSDIQKFTGAFGISVTEDCPSATDDHWYQSDDVEISIEGAYAEIKWDVPDEIKDYINISDKGYIQFGYWWGGVQSIRLESIICSYSTAFEIPVDNTKTTSLNESLNYKNEDTKSLKIPIEKLINDDHIPQYFEVSIEGSAPLKKMSGAFGISVDDDCPSATDDHWYQSKNFAVITDSTTALLYWRVPDDIKNYISDDGDFMFGFWWSESENITVKSITVKSSIGNVNFSADNSDSPEANITDNKTYKSSVPENAQMHDITSQQIVSDMRIGWNLGNSLDCYDKEKELSVSDSETYWGNPVVTKDMIDTVKKAGFNAVRIPVSWTNHLSDDNTIDPEWLDRVNEVVDYVIDNDMYAIINIHHDDYTWLNPSKADEKAVTEKFTKIWEQISERFRDYDYHLLFEGMNEPRIIDSPNEWTGGTPEEREVINNLFDVFVKTVRSSGGNNTDRHLIITSHAASITDDAVKAVKIPDDDKIIVSVHYYSPWDFSDPDDDSAQSAEWGTDSDKLELDKGFDLLKSTFIDKGTPVIIGEFGSVNKNNYAKRTEYTEYYIESAKKRGITCFLWDEGSNKNFGMLNRKDLTWYFPDIIEEAVDAVESDSEI